MWRKWKKYFDKCLKTNLWIVNLFFTDPQNYLHIMRTFLNHIKNEIKTSLENFWQRMIQLSEFFQYSFVLILKRKCLVGASRVRCRESGTPSTIIYTRSSSRLTNLDVMLLCFDVYSTNSREAGNLGRHDIHMNSLPCDNCFKIGRFEIQ